MCLLDGQSMNGVPCTALSRPGQGADSGRAHAREDFGAMVREAGSAAGPTLAVDVLGPMRLTVGGVDVEVPGPKRRAGLALLTLAAPRAASSDGLIDAVWPEEPPASARAALQSHVSRLRGHLGDAASRLVANGAGYRLQLEPAELDAARVDALVKEARTVATGDPVSAMDLLAQAQDFWRGDALEEFRDVEPLTAWGRTLADLRLTAAELLAECALAAGDAASATRVAAEAVAGEPLREPTVLLLMRALAAAGRSADALRAGHDYRRPLPEDPGP